MTDEILGGVVIDPDEQLEPASPLVTEAAPAAGEPEPEDEFADVQKVDLRGETLVPLSALKAERQKSKGRSDAFEAELAQLRPKAKQADEFGQYVINAKPYIEALRNRPDLMRQVQEQRPVPVPDQPILAPEKAEQLARTLELYTPDGQPDIKRAQAMGQFIDEMAEKKARQAVEPALVGEQTRLSVEQFQRAATRVTQSGQRADPVALKDWWVKVPPKLSSDPQVAEVLWRMAIADTVMAQKSKPAVPEREPLMTESVGGRALGTRTLSTVERKVAHSRGMTEKQWHEAGDSYKPGQPNVLED